MYLEEHLSLMNYHLFHKYFILLKCLKFNKLFSHERKINNNNVTMTKRQQNYPFKAHVLLKKLL